MKLSKSTIELLYHIIDTRNLTDDEERQLLELIEWLKQYKIILKED